MDHCQRETGRITQSARLDLPLFIEGQLLPQEQDFRAEGCPRPEHQMEETKSVGGQIGYQVEE
jgi:hypothetical protein